MNEDITIEVIINTLKSTCKWKSPGIDKIINFGFYHVYSTHDENYFRNHLKNWKDDWLAYRSNIPSIKTKETTNVKKPTDLSYAFSIYKMMTWILKERIFKFIECKEIYPLELQQPQIYVLSRINAPAKRFGH